MFIRILKILFWSLYAIGVLLILSITNKKHNNIISKLPEIYIKINGENAFLTQKELQYRLKRNGLITDNQNMKNLKISEIEKSIKNMSEIKNVSVFKNVNGTWNINVELRKPIARVFNCYGESFYIDEDGYTMTTSHLFTARTLVFTGNINERINDLKSQKIINNKTLKTNFFLDDIYRISYYVCSSPFWSSLLGQVYLDKNGDFVLVPMIGDFKILFGRASNFNDVKVKMDKLWIFYSNALPYEGWNKYELINLKYSKQIVCKKKAD